MIKSLLDDEANQSPETKSESENRTLLESYSETNAEPMSASVKTDSAADDNFVFRMQEKPARNDAKPMFQTDFKPETLAETARKSGLAYAAGITLVAAVVFLMVLGWFADLLFGTSPWGIVGGIVLGSIIGFIQFFRLTSQILKNKD